MNKLNLNFHTFGRACFRFTSYHSGEKLSLAIVGTFVLLSLSNPGCLPIPYNFSVNGTHCTHFLFSLVSKCICYWERWPKLKDIEKMIICPIAKNKCFVWNYVIQDMVSSNKYKILIRSENCGDHQLSDLGYIHQEKDNNSSHQPQNSHSSHPGSRNTFDGDKTVKIYLTIILLSF